MTSAPVPTVTLSYGYGVNAVRLKRETLSLDKLAAWVSQHVMPLRKLSPDAHTFAAFNALPVAERDAIKIHADFVTAALLVNDTRSVEQGSDGGVAEVVTCLTIDVDSAGLSAAEIMQRLGDTTCHVMWSTAKSTADDPRYRVLLPLAEPVDPAVFEGLARRFLHAIGLDKGVDRCTFRVKQPALLPIAFSDVAPELYSGGTRALDLHTYADVTLPAPAEDTSIADLLDGAPSVDRTAQQLQQWKPRIANLPIDEARQILLENIDVVSPDCGYADWMAVGFALHHQFHGSTEACELWDEWSSHAGGDVYPGSAVIAVKWEQMRLQGGFNGRPVTFRSVLDKAGIRQVDSWRRGQTAQRYVRQLAECATEEKVRQLCAEYAVDPNAPPLEASRLVEQAAQARIRELTAAQNGLSVKEVGRIPITTVRKWLTPGAGLDDNALSVDTGDIDETTLARMSWASEWCYLRSAGAFMNRRTRERLGEQAFNASLRSRLLYEGKIIAEPVRWATGECEAWSRGRIPAIKSYAGPVYYPGGNDVIRFSVHNGEDGPGALEWFNSWTPASMPRRYDKATLLADYDPETRDEFSALIKQVIAVVFQLFRHDRRARRILYAWMAYQVQNPGAKIRWMPVLYGAEGNGKTTIHQLMGAALGPANTKVASPRTIGGRFSDWATGAMLITIEEIKLPREHAESMMIINNLKPYITNDTVSLDEKNKNSTTIPNKSNLMATTNEGHALPFESTDRRYCVLECACTTAPQMEAFLARHPTLFEDLYAMLKRPRAGSFIASWLASLDIPRLCPEFHPDKAAPATAGKARMAYAARPRDLAAIEELMVLGADGVYSATDGAVVFSRSLWRELESITGHKVAPARVPTLTTAAGLVLWEGEAQGRVYWQGTRGRVFTTPNYAGLTGTEVLARLNRTKMVTAATAFAPYLPTLGDSDDAAAGTTTH